MPLERENNLSTGREANLFRHMGRKDTAVSKCLLGKVHVEEVGHLFDEVLAVPGAAWGKTVSQENTEYARR